MYPGRASTELESAASGSRVRPSRHLRVIAVAIVATAALVGLTGCSGVAASRSGAAISASTVPTALPRDRTVTGTSGAGGGAGGAGSLTVAITKPVSVAGHVDTTVSCTTGRQYRATAGPVVIDGTSISLQVVAAGYTGAGSYSAIVTASVTPSGSDATEVAGLPGIPASITSTGGQVDLSATGTAGRVLAGSFTWACS